MLTGTGPGIGCPGADWAAWNCIGAAVETAGAIPTLLRGIPGMVILGIGIGIGIPGIGIDIPGIPGIGADNEWGATN